jgi:thiamine-phosphate pyrophosphorylase
VNPRTTTWVVVLTDRVQAAAAGRSVHDTVAAALDGGAGAVVLREKDLPAAERRALAADLLALTARHRAALIVASDPVLARQVGADGLHLAADEPWPTGAPLPPRGVGRSCHTVADLVVAGTHGAAWVTYSPVHPTDSKPGHGPPLGPEGLAAGCRAVPDLPVLALGGIGPGRARACVEAGAAGVALMGAVMRADDPAAVVRAVVDEVAADAVQSRP